MLGRFRAWALQNPWPAAAVMAAEVLFVAALFLPMSVGTAVTTALIWGGVMGVYLTAKRDGTASIQRSIMWVAAGSVALLVALLAIQARPH